MQGIESSTWKMKPYIIAGMFAWSEAPLHCQTLASGLCTCSYLRQPCPAWPWPPCSLRASWLSWPSALFPLPAAPRPPCLADRPHLSETPPPTVTPIRVCNWKDGQPCAGCPSKNQEVTGGRVLTVRILSGVEHAYFPLVAVVTAHSSSPHCFPEKSEQ